MLQERRSLESRLVYLSVPFASMMKRPRRALPSSNPTNARDGHGSIPDERQLEVWTGSALLALLSLPSKVGYRAWSRNAARPARQAAIALRLLARAPSWEGRCPR